MSENTNRLFIFLCVLMLGVSCTTVQSTLAPQQRSTAPAHSPGNEDSDIVPDDVELVWSFWDLWSARLPIQADEIERLEYHDRARWLEDRIVFAQIEALEDLEAIRPHLEHGVTLEIPAYALEHVEFVGGLARLSRNVELHVIVRGRVVDATLMFLTAIPELRGLRLAADSPGFSDDGLAQLRSLGELRSLSARVGRRLGPKGIGAIASLIHLRWLVLQSSARDLSRLSALHQLESLRLFGGDEQLRMTSGMPELNELILDHSRITDEGLATLGNLGELRTLRLLHTQVTGETLPTLPQLRRLEMRHTDVNDAGLAQLGRQPRLETLGLHGAHVTDEGLSSLSNLSSLRTLHVISLNHVSACGLAALPPSLRTLSLDLGARVLGSSTCRSPQLGHLRALESLRLYRVENADLSFLARLAALRELRLPQLIRDDTLIHLSELHQLRTLNLENVRLPAAAFEALAALNELVEINLRGTHLSSLEPLRQLALLEDLNVSNTSVADLSPLSGLRSLKRLDLAATHAEDLSPLASLSNLTTLGLSHNAISNHTLVHLQGLPLEWLQLSYTAVGDEGLPALAQVRTLKQLSLAHTQISDAGLLVFAGHPSLDMIDVEGTSATGPTAQVLRGIQIYH